MNFNLEDYEPVEERIKKFYKDYPKGSITTELISDDGNRVVFKAFLYKELGDTAFWTTGYAEERKDDGKMVNKTSHMENGETSAIGRALANANYSGDKRPSREEMEKVARTTVEKTLGFSPRPTRPQKNLDDLDLTDFTDGKPTRDTLGHTYCEKCGKVVSKKVEDFSVSKFGKILCMDCQKAANV